MHRLPPDAALVTVAMIEQALGKLPPPGEAPAPAAAPPAAPPTADELRAALDEHGSVHALARHYGKDRRQIYRWLEAFGLRERR